MRIQILWFQDCPNHHAARVMIADVLRDLRVDATVEAVEVPDAETGARLCFPGSPTIRVDGEDIEPGWQPCDDCTPRCRLYATQNGLRGLPEREWLADAIRRRG